MRPLPPGVQAPAWLLGESAFTTLRTWDGAPLLWEAHLARLRGTCAWLGLPDPDEALPPLDRTGWGLLRVTVTAEGTFHSWRPLAPGPRPAGGVAVQLTGIQVHPQLAEHKTGSSLPYLLAGRAAAAAGAFEGWLTDGAGHLVDGSRTAPLLELDGRLVVPSGGLPGVTRAAFLAGRAAETRPVGVAELPRVSRAWVCGSGVGVVPVRRIEGEGWSVDLPAEWPAVTDRALVWPGEAARP